MIESAILIFFLMRRFGGDFSRASYSWLNDYLVQKENGRGRLYWTATLSALLIMAAMIYARFDTHPGFLGAHYVKLAENPFAFDPANPVSYRLLTPMLSWLIGFRGRGLLILNLLLSGVFVGLVYSYYRKAAQQAGDAFLAAVIATFSLVVLTSLYCGGYCDIMTYLLIFLMWQFRRKRILFYGLFLLGLLNRESLVFLVPWFIFITWELEGNWKTKIPDILVGFGLSTGAYLLFRLWVESYQTVPYSTAYYFDGLFADPLKMLRSTAEWHSLGLFSVFKLMWVVPALAIVSWFKEREYRPLIGLALLLFGAYAQLFIAFDTSRMLTLSFMVMFISLNHLLEGNRFQVRSWIFWVVLFNIIIPQPYTASNKVEVWQSLSTYAILQNWR